LHNPSDLDLELLLREFTNGAYWCSVTRISHVGYDGGGHAAQEQRDRVRVPPIPHAGLEAYRV